MKTAQRLDNLLTAIRSELYHQQRARDPQHNTAPANPFVTISRQAGAGGHSLGAALAADLNERDSRGPAWSVWDRDLVEKVAAEHKIPEQLVRSLEGPGRPWFEQCFSTLDDMQVYRRVVATIRSLARAGRSVIIGRGSVFATGDLAGGVHVRLVAPLNFRIESMAKLLNVPSQKAEEEIRRVEHERAAFYQRYWPTKPLVPEAFTLTINTAVMDEPTQVRCILQPLDALAAQGTRRFAPMSLPCHR